MPKPVNLPSTLQSPLDTLWARIQTADVLSFSMLNNLATWAEAQIAANVQPTPEISEALADLGHALGGLVRAWSASGAMSVADGPVAAAKCEAERAAEALGEALKDARPSLRAKALGVDW